MSPRFFRAFPLFLLFLTVFSSSSPAEQPLITNLRSVLNDFHAANPSAPGIVVRVASPSRGLKWTAAVGLSERDTRDPLTAKHTFRIASNTKTYVAAAILRLAEGGRLALDDPLENHLPPDFRRLLEADDYDLEAITIRQVLAHTSGMFEHPADPRYEEAILADPYHRWTRLEQITRCVEWGDAVGAPGEKFSYSDTGYIILGGIIESITGLNLGAAVRDLLDFEGLGLTATWWEILEEKPNGAGPRAHQYYGDEDAYNWDPSLDLYGGGGLICDVRDLGSFIRLLLQGQVLQRESSLADMLGSGTTDCRLGIFCVDFGEYLAWGHTGFWNTFAWHVPTLDVTVSGCILDHFATKGQELAEQLVETVAASSR